MTPFKPDYEFDGVSQKAFDYLVKNRAHGIMTTGGNGEFPHLLQEERKKVLEITIEAVKGQISIIACTASCSTKETLMLTAYAKEVEADLSS